jgi:hypothetical protein
MSEEYNLTVSKLAVFVLGIITFVLGIVLVYFSWTADVGIVGPKMFTPLGIVIILSGGLLLIVRGD